MEEAGAGSTRDANTATPLVRQYGDVAFIYDALMAGVPHRLWLARILTLAAERGKTPRSALDIACGTGLVTEQLYGRGLAPVVGVDLSAPMIAIARTKAQAGRQNITYFQQDAARLDLGARTFDLVVSLFDSLNYLTDPGALEQAFNRIFAHTAPGGLFAFDLNSLYALANRLFDQEGTAGPVRHVWHSYWDRDTRVCRIEMAFWVRDPATGETRHFTETHLQRAYTVPEVTEWLAEAGFTNIRVFSNYGTRAPGPKTDRLLFVADR